jgi:5-methylcytosine-specific restriction protein A
VEGELPGDEGRSCDKLWPLFFMANDDEYFLLDRGHTDPKRMKKEREKARELRQTAWWKRQVEAGICHHCQQKVPSRELTMDHLVPLARGGQSVKNNLVPSCKGCNSKKKLSTPVDLLLRALEDEKKSRS